MGGTIHWAHTAGRLWQQMQHGGRGSVSYLISARRRPKLGLIRKDLQPRGMIKFTRGAARALVLSPWKLYNKLSVGGRYLRVKKKAGMPSGPAASADRMIDCFSSSCRDTLLRLQHCQFLIWNAINFLRYLAKIIIICATNLLPFHFGNEI